MLAISCRFSLVSNGSCLRLGRGSLYDPNAYDMQKLGTPKICQKCHLSVMLLQDGRLANGLGLGRFSHCIHAQP
jgi:hypothetical protein